MKKRAKKLRGGFTMLEVVVALALGVIVIGSVTLIMAQVLLAQRRQRLVSDMQRDAEFASTLLTLEVRQAGLGVPGGTYFPTSSATGFLDFGTGVANIGTEYTFAARHLIVARPTEIGILADIPRPDSNYNVFGPLNSRATGNPPPATPPLTNPDFLAWHTENNGTCVPCAVTPPAPNNTLCPTVPGCSIRGGASANGPTSLFFPNAGATAECISGTAPSGSVGLGCPWASRRLAAGERLQIVDGGGSWTVDGVSTLTPATSPNGMVALALTKPMDPGSSKTFWPNNAAGDGPGGTAGQGFATTLDRIFYQLVGTNIVRTQCWGDPDPANANWPPDGVNTTPGSPGNINPAVDGSDVTHGAGDVQTSAVCIGPEVVARNVVTPTGGAGLNFQYSDANGANVPVNGTTSAATLNTIAGVTWNITLSRSDNTVTTKVSYVIEGGAAIQNK
jgi:prepilin-type N-terminal cleavage/methylation domain-containing protein